MAKELRLSKEEYAVCDQCRAKKIRCDRERPRCGNCNRLDLQCEWSGQGKKGNQTTLLNQTIFNFESRLQHVEVSLLENRKSIREIMGNQSGAPSAPRRKRNTLSGSGDICSEDLKLWNIDPTAKPGVSRKRGRLLRGPDDRERYFGPTSLDSVILDIKDKITDCNQHESNSMRGTVEEALHKIDFLFREKQEDGMKEATLPTAPPFALLDAMVTSYFATINSSFPIWTKEKFCRMSLALRSSETSEQNLSSIISCNNVVLLTLSNNSFSYDKAKLARGKLAKRTSSSDLDFVSGFLVNSKRALKYIDQFLSPSLLNVQALLSLYLVSQVFLTSATSEMFLTLATRCAKSIGIHQWSSNGNQLNTQDVKERQNLCYCLYILDKSFCWSSGSSPNLLLLETYVDPESRSFDRVTSSLVVKLRLAKIMERIYFEIYAGQPELRCTEATRQCSLELLSSLQSWLADTGLDLDEITKTVEFSPFKLELMIRFFSAKLLLIWPNELLPDAVFQEKHLISRRIMELLHQLWLMLPKEDYQEPFPLFLASIPPLYVREILIAALSGHDSNLDLLKKFNDMLQIITDHQSEASYNLRLRELCSITVDVITARATERSHKRHKSASISTSHTSSPYYDEKSLCSLIPDLPSPSASSYQGFSPGINTNPYEDFTISLSSLRTSNDADGPLTGVPDELFQSIDNFVKETPEAIEFSSFSLGFLADFELGRTYNM